MTVYRRSIVNDFEQPRYHEFAQWKIFEGENPDTFINMYQLWVRKGE